MYAKVSLAGLLLLIEFLTECLTEYLHAQHIQTAGGPIHLDQMWTRNQSTN